MHPRFSLDEIKKLRAKLYDMKVPSDQLNELEKIFHDFMRKEIIADKDGEKELDELVKKLRKNLKTYNIYERFFDKMVEEIRNKAKK